MKHLFVLLLALLLTGCTAEVPDTGTIPAQPPPVTDSTAAEPVKQPAKLRSHRALSIYDTGIMDCRGIYAMGKDMVLISGTGETLLTVLSDGNAHIATQKRLPCQVSPEDGSMQINKNGIAYYDSIQNAVIFLNTDLLETQQIPLPDYVRGSVLLSPD